MSDPEVIEIRTPDDLSPERLDRYLGSHSDINISRTRAQSLISEGLVTVNGEECNGKLKLRGGEKIRIVIPEKPKSELAGEDIPLDILFEDDYLAVINKPAGMVTHPGAGNQSGTLVHALIHHFEDLSSVGDADRPGIVHRLDKNTPGLLLIAKTDETHRKLQEAIQKREVKRTYLALTCGHVKEEAGLVDLPIGRSMRDRKKMTVTHKASREAKTEYKLIDRFRTYDLLEVILHTGRTHQIRVHFSHLGHPIFGDPEYGGRESWHKGIFAPERPLAKKLLAALAWQALLSKKVEFEHPVTGMAMRFEVDPPQELQELLNILDEEGR